MARDKKENVEERKGSARAPCEPLSVFLWGNTEECSAKDKFVSTFQKSEHRKQSNPIIYQVADDQTLRLLNLRAESCLRGIKCANTFQIKEQRPCVSCDG